MGKAIGIDLGTTYSAVAVLKEDGKPEILMNREGQNITPSVVFFQDYGSGDEPLVGDTAKRSAATNPADVVQFVKRNIGNSSWKFVSSHGDSYSAEEISAIILKRLKEDAEMALGEQVTDAVISVPAYFDDARRTATKQAGKIAGLNVLRIINEPTAAALAYGLDISDDGNIFVYDLGGGTFDVTIMQIKNGEFNVIATDGNRNLGGFDFDNRIAKFIIEELKYQGLDSIPDDERFNAEIRERAEIAKRSLTTTQQANIMLNVSGKPYKVVLTRDKFEEITRDLLRTTEELTEYVLQDANMTWSDIDHLLLVGGSTRMVMVREMMERISGKKAIRGINPDEVVALGAGIQAAMSCIESGEGDEYSQTSFNPPMVSDVTSQALGVIMLNDAGVEENVVVIPRNSKIPCSDSKIGSTVTDNQNSIFVRVTQGEDKDIRYVTEIGSKDIPIPAYPKGAEVRISYNYDIDQTVFVEVFDLTSNKSLGTFEIERIQNLSNEELATAMKKIERLSIN